LLAGNLPPLTGQELKAVRVNAAADGIEMQTVTAAGWAFLAGTATAAQQTALGLVNPRPLLATLTASDTATLEFTGFDAAEYIAYEFIFSDLTFAGGIGRALRARTSSNGGSSYDSGASDYDSSVQSFTGTTLSGGSGAEAHMRISGNLGMNTGTNKRGFTGRGTLFNPGAALFTHMTVEGSLYSSDGNLTRVFTTNARESAADVDGIQFYMTTGNIVSGTIYVYGIRG